MNKSCLLVVLGFFFISSAHTATVPVLLAWRKFIMSLNLNRLPLATIAIASLVAPPSFASTFSWTPGNTDIIVNADSLELTVGGITATVQAFTAEINTAVTDADVVGPWPTQVSPGSGDGFGVDVRGLGSEQLGLIADPSLIPTAGGSDHFSGGLSPGFASSYSSPAEAPSAFHFALFSFDQPVDIPGVTVDDVANLDRNIWMATGTTTPDFTSGFLSGLMGFNIVNSADDTGDGLFTHSLGAMGISYLFVGAPAFGSPSYFVHTGRAIVLMPESSESTGNKANEVNMHNVSGNYNCPYRQVILVVMV